MLATAASRLQQHCAHRAGDSLRAIMVYQDDGLDVQYIRDDVERTYADRDRLDRIGDLAWETHQRRRALVDEPTQTGRLRAVVLSFDRAYLIQFPMTNGGGLLAAFDTDAGRVLGDFIRECRTQVRPVLGKD